MNIVSIIGSVTCAAGVIATGVIWDWHNRKKAEGKWDPNVFHWEGHLTKRIKYAYERVTKGYCRSDVIHLTRYLMHLIPDMTEMSYDLMMGSEAFFPHDPDDKYFIERKRWMKEMNYYFRESEEESCLRKNPYDGEFHRLEEVFEKKYGEFGEKLCTPEELETGRRHRFTIYSAPDPVMKEIAKRWLSTSFELDEYRERCAQKAVNLMGEHFFELSPW